MTLAVTLYSDIVPWFILAAGFIGAAWINKRGATGEALSYLEKANEILHKENTDLKKERAGLIAQVEALKAKTDITAALKPLADWQVKHEQNAEERWNKLMKALELIAKGLGSESEL